MKSLRQLALQFERLNDWIGRAVAWLTFGMVLTTFAVVLLRYLFNSGSIAVQESITYMHALVFMLGAAYTLQQDGHVRVDILYRRASLRQRAIIDLAGTLFLLLPVCGFILFISWEYVAASWSLLEGSREAGGLPGVFLLKSAIPLMALLLVLQGLANLVRDLNRLLEPVADPAAER